MHFVIRGLLFLLLLSPLRAQEQKVEVRTNGGGDIEILVMDDAGSWRAAGRAGDVLSLRPGEYRPNKFSHNVNVDVILRGPGYLPIAQTLTGKASEVVVLEAFVVPEQVRVKLNTVPAESAAYGPKDEFWGRGTLELTPSKYLPADTSLNWSRAAFSVRPVEMNLRAPGYSEKLLTLGAEFWTSSVYPAEPVVLEPEKGVKALFQRHPKALAILSPLALLAFLYGAYHTRRRLLKGRKLESLRADDSDPLAGAALGSYRLGRLLGEGAMGSVYLAVPKESLEKVEAVAVKVIHRRLAGDPEFLSRFHREVKVAGELIHPNIVECFDWGNQDGLLFLVLELLEGEPLSARVRPNAPVEEVVRCLLQVARALVYAHKEGVVHRDIKPENVMVTRDGVVKVMDFGLAKKHDASTLTATGAIFGTPAYLPPEQARSEPVDAAADQYSFGVMAFELLAGERPYQADEPVQMMLKHVSAPVPSVLEHRPDIPPELATMIARMMAKKPGDRYPSMQDVLAELERFV